jgi:hypothetical protein
LNLRPPAPKAITGMASTRTIIPRSAVRLGADVGTTSGGIVYETVTGCLRPALAWRQLFQRGSARMWGRRAAYPPRRRGGQELNL